MTPRQKPGRSEQVVGTPEEFIMAVEERFGHLSVDLAATAENAKAPFHIGPESDSLKQKWNLYDGNLWLNPPFGHIKPWVKKASKTIPSGRILVLVPASVGSNWFADHVWGRARVYFLRPRMMFVGHTAGYPKDLMLLVYGEEPGVELWRWKEPRSKS